MPMPGALTEPDDLAIVRELGMLAADARPLQFQNLMTGSQYLPIYRLARRYAAPGMRALDWGCGNGHFSYFLLRQGLEVDGFNLAAQANPLAATLQARFGDRYRMRYGADDDPIALPYPNGQFDLVCSIGVLEHVRETGGTEPASLAEIHRVLKPGGHFLCGMLPKRYSWIEFVVRHAFPAKHWHAYRYTRSEIAALIGGAGLRLKEVRTHGFLPRNSLNHRLLGGVHNRPVATRGFNAVDRVLSMGAAAVAQNFLLAAEKPA